MSPVNPDYTRLPEDPAGGLPDPIKQTVEKALLYASQATCRLIKTALATCRPELVGKSALEYVHRREVGNTTNERPFYAGHKAKTVRKYRDAWVKILRYIWRTSEREKSQRPGYVLTKDQTSHLAALKLAAARQALNTDRQTKAERRRELEAVSLDFWISMFRHELQDDEYENGILSGLAVLGINPTTQDWQPAANFTPVLSAVVTVMRALVVYKAWSIRLAAIDEGSYLDLSQEEVLRNAPSVFTSSFMTLITYGGMPSPIDRILHMRTYGLKIRFTTKATGKVSWPKADTIAVDKISLSMDDIRAVIHGLNESAWHRLVEDLLILPNETRALETASEEGQGSKLPDLNMAELFDDPSEMIESWSFLKDPRNTFSVDGHKWMWKRLFNEPGVAIRLTSGDMDAVQCKDDIKWDENKVQRYFQKVKAFKEELFALVHLTGGAPARGTEILSVQHENGEGSRSQRGIFIDQGLVAFVTSYHKGYSASQKVKIIHRYVPKEVGELVVYFLWLVEPFVRQLLVSTRKQLDFSSFLWEHEPEEQLVDEEDPADMNQSADEDQGNVDDEQSTRDSDSEEEATESPLSPQLRTAKNVDGFWNADRVRHVIGRETSSRIGVRINTATWRQIYPAIQREHTREKKVKDKLGEVYDGQQKKEEDDYRERQSGHGRRMEEMIYGLLTSESPFYTKSEQAEFRAVSLDWHRFLHFESAWLNPDGAQLSASKDLLDKENAQAQFRRWGRLRQIDLQHQLERLHGHGTQFKHNQRPVLEAVIGGHPRILAIMKTGGGKSLFFMLPAASSKEGVTIVIVPLNSLRDDLMDRCKQAGIPCASWQGRNPAHWANIMFVTPESAVTKSFGTYMNQKRAVQQLDRIVVDECHAILDSTDAWRPKLRLL
ncbi:hypothetical protein E4T42_09726 [Aureobasidium subglaciale]|nr:hypothetical protein E4T42_09726 [Aureobasidium subglaciale]